MVIRMADKNRRAELVRNFSSEWLSWISCNYSETELQVTASSLDIAILLQVQSFWSS